jgi:hypothetical protein
LRLAATGVFNKIAVSLQFHEKFHKIMDAALQQQSSKAELIKRFTWLLFITAKKKLLKNVREDLLEVAYILFVVIRKVLNNLPEECPFALECTVEEFLKQKMNAPEKSQEIIITGELFEELCLRVSVLLLPNNL